MNILYSLFSLFIVFVSLIGYGNLFFFRKRTKDLFIILLAGYFTIGFITLFLHFFFPINTFLSLTIIFFGFLFLVVTKFNFLEKKIWTYLCLLIFTSILLIGYSNHAIDANMYHHPYVSYLKSEKIIISIANIQFRFGHISLMQYVQSALTNDFLSPLSLSSLNIIFFTFFLIYCGEILFKKNENNLIFLIVLFFSCFVLIKMGRYREFGNDLIPFLVCSYFFIRILKEKNNQNNHKSIFIYLPIFACFMISHKITYVFSALIFISIISKQNLIFIFKEKKFLLFSISFAFLWFLKTYVETSCLIYPVVQTCIKNSGWYLNGVADPEKAMWQSEIWAKGFIDNPEWRNINLKYYSDSFTWLPTWLNNHFIKILEKLSPLFVIMTLVTSYLILHKTKTNYKNNKNQINTKFLFIILTSITLGLSIWFLNSPLFRYGSFYLVSFVTVIYIIIHYNLIIKIDYLNLKKLKVIFFISIILFCNKNIQRYIKSDDAFLPLTNPSIENYEFVNKEPNIIRPKKLQICYYTNYICSNEIPNIKILKKKNYYLIKG